MNPKTNGFATGHGFSRAEKRYETMSQVTAFSRAEKSARSPGL
jgi:hypothetical protein